MNMKNHKFIVCMAIGALLVNFLLYGWSIPLPIIGDGLMHLSDETHFSSPFDIIRAFYTFEGLGKPAGSMTLGFHRPVFNELLVPVVHELSGGNTAMIRAISILVHAVNTILAYVLCYRLSGKRGIAVAGSFLLATSLIYFNGIYEYGLSFSLWLTMFSLLAFLFLVEYNKNCKNVNLLLSLFFSFCAVFTKESAVTLGVALSFYVVMKALLENKRINSSIAAYVMAQSGIIALYFITRYLKLGSLFGIAGGIEGKVSLTGAIAKVAGYFAYSLNLSTSIIPGYMTVHLDKLPWLVGLLFLAVTGYGLINYSRKAVRKPRNADFFISLVMFVLLIIPTIKVTRNAPYYGDIAHIAILYLFTSIAVYYSEKGYKKIAAYVFLYASIFVLTVSFSVKENSTYLTEGTNEAKIIYEDIVSNTPRKEHVYQGSSWMKDSGNHYKYNHGNFGSFYRYNVADSAAVSMLTMAEIAKLDADSLVLDYFYDKNARKIALFYMTQGNLDNHIVKITYQEKEKYAQNLEFTFTVDTRTFFQKVDLNYKKIWSKENVLFFVIPRKAKIDFSSDDITDVEYITF